MECIQLSPTGLIAGSVRGPVLINPSNGSCEECVKPKDSSMTVVTCFKAIGRWIIGASSLSTEINVWDVHSKSCSATLRGASNVVCLDIMGNPPETIVTGNDDGTIGVWDVESKKCVKVMEGHEYMVTSISIIGNFVVSTSIDRTVKVWPIEYGQCMETWEGHSGAVTCSDVLGDMIITGSYDSTVRMWSLASSECSRVVDHPDEVLCLKAKGYWVVTACGDKFIRLLEADTGKCIRKIMGPSVALSLDFDGYCIVGGFENNTVCMWSIDALTSNFAPPSSPIRYSSECYLQRLRSLPSGIPKCPSLPRNPSLSRCYSGSLILNPRSSLSQSRVLHSAASDLPDEESDIFKGDTLSDVSDEVYQNFELDVAVAIENVLKDEFYLASPTPSDRDSRAQILSPGSTESAYTIEEDPTPEDRDSSSQMLTIESQESLYPLKQDPVPGDGDGDSSTHRSPWDTPEPVYTREQDSIPGDRDSGGQTSHPDSPQSRYTIKQHSTPEDGDGSTRISPPGSPESAYTTDEDTISGDTVGGVQTPLPDSPECTYTIKQHPTPGDGDGSTQISPPDSSESTCTIDEDTISGDSVGGAQVSPPDSPEPACTIKHFPTPEYAKNVMACMEQSCETIVAGEPSTSTEKIDSFCHPIGEDSRPSRFARVVPTEEATDIRENIIEPIGVVHEKIEEQSGDKADAITAAIGETQPEIEPSNGKPFSFTKFLLRTMPCLLAGGAWFIFRARMHK